MDLVVMGFFNGLVVFSILHFVFNINASRHAGFLIVLIPFASFVYMVLIPWLLLGAFVALFATAIGAVAYMAGSMYPKSDLDANKKTLTIVNSILLVAISLITIYVYPAAKIAEPIQKIFGNIGFNVVVGTIFLLSATNIFANIVSLQSRNADGDIDQ